MADSADAILRRIGTRLQLDRPLTFLDLEATGPFPDTDRVVEIAAATVHPGGRVVRFETLVNPEVRIPASATAIHGLRKKDLKAAPTFAALAPKLYRALDGRALAGYNLIRYDLRLLAAEFDRVGLAYDSDGAEVIDIMRIFHIHEPRDLAAAVRFYLGRKYQGHRARPDVDATIAVLDAQLERYSLPTDASDLAEYSRNQPPDWLTRDGRIAWRDGAPRVTFGRHAGESLQSLARDRPEYLRWILANDFAADVQQLVRAAAAGRFPARPPGLDD